MTPTGDGPYRELPSTWSGWRVRSGQRTRPVPDAGDVFQQQHLRFVAAWAISDLDDVHRRGRWKRVLVCWWAHRPSQALPGEYPPRACWACTARWAS